MPPVKKQKKHLKDTRKTKKDNNVTNKQCQCDITAIYIDL